MHKESGFTLAEVVVATSIAALVMTSAVSAALPALARERLRSATYELQSTLQVSRIEAVARNRPTRFVMNQDSRTIEAWDTQGTSSTMDDELIRRVNLPRTVSIARPDSGDAVTMGQENVSGIHEVVFSADGSAPGSTGEIALYGGGQYRKLDLQAAGGVAVDRWVDDGWEKVERVNEAKLERLWDQAREGYEDDWTDPDPLDSIDPNDDDGTWPDYTESDWPDDNNPPDGPTL